MELGGDKMATATITEINYNHKFKIFNVSLDVLLQEAVPAVQDPDTLEETSPGVPERRQTLSYSIPRQELEDKMTEANKPAKTALLLILKAKFEADVAIIEAYKEVKELVGNEYPVNI